MRQIIREDSLPWYRQFWPWFLILLPASVVVAGLSMVYIANRHADDLVVDDYYKEGLAINRQLAKKQRAEEMQLSAELAITASTVTARLSGPVTDSALKLSLSHPLEADRDFTVPLSRIGDGLYRASHSQAIAPNWHWTLESLQEDSWRLDGEVIEANFEHAGG